MGKENGAIKQSVEKQDSIKVSRNAKGNLSFEIKRYFCADNTQTEDLIADMKATEGKLLETFPDKEAK